MSSGAPTTTTQMTQLDPLSQQAKTLGLQAAQNVAALPYVPYGEARIAGFRPQEMQAFGMAQTAADNNLGAEQLNLATEAAKRAAGYSPAQFQQDVSGFMSPYQNQVIDATMSRLAAERAKRDAQTKADLAAAKAFGNDRRGVYEAEIAGQQDLNTAQTLANLYNQGYSQASSMAANLPSQQLAGASQLAGFGNQAIQQQQQLMSMLGGAGQAQRQMAQQNLDLAYQDFVAQRDYPKQQLQTLLSGIAGTPSTTSTSQTTPGDDFMTRWGKNTQAIASLLALV